MVISHLGSADYPRYVNLLRQLTGETPFLIYSFEELDALQRQIAQRDWRPSRLRQVWLAWVEQQPVGFLGLSCGTHQKTRHLASVMIGVLRRYWGEGLATRLLAEAETWAQDQGILRLELTVLAENARARSFYQREGYREEGVRYRSIFQDDQYQDEICMAKWLPEAVRHQP